MKKGRTPETYDPFFLSKKSRFRHVGETEPENSSLPPDDQRSAMSSGTITGTSSVRHMPENTARMAQRSPLT